MRDVDAVEAPLRIHSDKSPQQRRERVEWLMTRVGLQPDHVQRYPHEFSGGQRQRIGIARAITVEPDLLIADEPVSALDVSVQAQVLNLLEELQERLGLTYLVVAHDLAVVRTMSDRIAVMNEGKIVEMAQAEEVYGNPKDRYTRELLAAVPIPDPRKMKERKEERRRLRAALAAE